MNKRVKSIGWMFALMCCVVSCGAGTSKNTVSTTVKPLSFDADSAYQYTKQQTDFGPRVCGTDAHAQCKTFLVKKLQDFGAVVTEQAATLKGWNNMRVPSVNIIGTLFPEKKQRILLCAHWDSRPWADQDPIISNRNKPISGANDGASGVGVLLELARQLQLEAAKGNVPSYGVDIVFFDAEDLGTPSFAPESDAEETWCLGSTYWAQQAKASGYTAQYGILLDMVGGFSPKFYWDQYSYNHYQSILQNVWNTATKLGYGNYFIAAPGGGITDDHLPVHQIAGIPCIDIIDFDPASRNGFPSTWHTMDDTMKNIDRNSLKAVGATLINVLFGR